MLFSKGPPRTGFQIFFEIFCPGKIIKPYDRPNFPRLEFVRMNGLTVVMLCQAFVRIGGYANVKMLGGL